MKLSHLLGVVVAALFLGGVAHAACPTVSLTGLTGKDASAATQTLATITQSSQQSTLPVPLAYNGTTYAPHTSDASCNLDVNVQVTPQTGINVAVTPTIQSASYVSGNCMGGFQTVSMGTIPSVFNTITLASKGGLATSKQLYFFSANPSGSTCTDKGTFTIAAADISKVMGTLSFTPQAPVGATISFATTNNLGFSIPSGGVLYVAIVETATETPASTTDLSLLLGGF